MRNPNVLVPMLTLAALATATPARGAGWKPVRTILVDAKEAPLRAPEGVACADGALVVADTGNGRILTYAWRDGKLTGGAPVKVAGVTVPVRVQVDAKGNVLVLDRRTRRIVRVDAEGRPAGTVELSGAAAGSPIVPVAFRVAADDGLVVLDLAGRRVLVADASGKVGRELPLPAGGAPFQDVAVDRAGRILALDPVGGRIWAADPGSREFRTLGAPMRDQASFPAQIAVAESRVYVVDVNGGGLLVLGPEGELLSRELDLGQAEGRVSYPSQTCVTSAGQVVVADRGNDRVQILSPGR